MNTTTKKQQAKHYTLDTLPWCQGNGIAKATVRLHKGDSAPNPTCTNCRLWGPSTVDYERYPDGGINAFVSAD